MTRSMPDLPVAMWKFDLDDIPNYELDHNYYHTFHYEPGLEKIWTALQRRADQYNKIDSSLFFETFNRNETDLCNRILFLATNSEHIIGTAAAWMGAWPEHATDNHSMGRIHWVAIDPEYQGKGLSKPLMTQTCQRLKELNHTETYLTTSIVRIPAIKLYLVFGFYPALETREDGQRWRMIKDLLPSPLVGLTADGKLQTL